MASWLLNEFLIITSHYLQKAEYITTNTLLLYSSACSSILHFLQTSLSYTNLNS